MKNDKPEILPFNKQRRQMMKWLAITGGVMTLGGMIPTTVFAADDHWISCQQYTFSRGTRTCPVSLCDRSAS